MWDKKNKILAVIALALLVIALYITFVPEVQAQGGRCRKVCIKYWSQQHHAYITTYVWYCTSYRQPRPYYGRTYNRFRDRRN